ncbi:MAG TPA: 4'-phosphopantetheinyl transferase superfamily protein [Planctomycetota bacterium]|nr:4'-phosphopantetheinyl transferase superfamily protein [Planctomycetota bacterium]
MRTAAFEDAVLAARARGWLGPAEREAFDRLRPADARRDWLAAHGLARLFLSELTGAPPKRVPLRFPPGEPPRLADGSRGGGLHLSISHAAGAALCAVSEGTPVGADVESVENLGPDPLRVARVACSPRESADLEAAPATERAARLLVLWTAKEAVAKAAGTGLRLAPARIRILSPAGNGPRDPPAGEGRPWTVAWIRIPPTHAASVAVPCDPGSRVSFRFQEWRPGPPSSVRTWAVLPKGAAPREPGALLGRCAAVVS